DGKTSKQAKDDDGKPLHVLNVFAHGAKLCLADWPVGGGKATEPEVLKAHLDELFAAYPGLRVLTGDALFCQRPLAGALVGPGGDSVLAVMANEPALREGARTAGGAGGEPAVRVREKGAGRWRPAGSGTTRRRPTTPARR